MVVDHAFAGRDPGELVGGGGERHLELQAGIVVQAAEHDLAHLVAKAVEAAELVEYAALAAPEEHVGVGGKLVAVGAAA